MNAPSAEKDTRYTGLRTSMEALASEFHRRRFDGIRSDDAAWRQAESELRDLLRDCGLTKPEIDLRHTGDRLGERTITVSSFGLGDGEWNALFDRVAVAATALNEDVCIDGHGGRAA